MPCPAGTRPIYPLTPPPVDLASSSWKEFSTHDRACDCRTSALAKIALPPAPAPSSLSISCATRPSCATIEVYSSKSAGKSKHSLRPWKTKSCPGRAQHRSRQLSQRNCQQLWLARHEKEEEDRSTAQRAEIHGETDTGKHRLPCPRPRPTATSSGPSAF